MVSVDEVGVEVVGFCTMSLDTGRSASEPRPITSADEAGGVTCEAEEWTGGALTSEDPLGSV